MLQPPQGQQTFLSAAAAPRADGSSVPVEMTGLLGPLPGIVLRFAQPQDHSQALSADEIAELAAASAKRLREYSTGRMLARAALATLGMNGSGISRGTGRAPVWPVGFRGSITHTDELVGVATAREVDLAGVGIDLERRGRVRPAMQRRILTVGELARFGREGVVDPLLATVCFSAKESIYKAVNPLVGLFIGFREVEIELTPAAESPGSAVASVERAGRFRAFYVGANRSNRILEAGEGRYCCLGRHVFTLFFLA